MDGNSSLPREVIRQVSDNNAEKFVSLASLWEMIIKIKKGKLRIPIPMTKMEQEMEENGFLWLQIKSSHLLKLMELEVHKNHKDPFDRLLVAQSRVEGIMSQQ